MTECCALQRERANVCVASVCITSSPLQLLPLLHSLPQRYIHPYFYNRISLTSPQVYGTSNVCTSASSYPSLPPLSFPRILKPQYPFCCQQLTSSVTKLPRACRRRWMLQQRAWGEAVSRLCLLRDVPADAAVKQLMLCLLYASHNHSLVPHASRLHHSRLQCPHAAPAGPRALLLLPPLLCALAEATAATTLPPYPLLMLMVKLQ